MGADIASTVMFNRNAPSFFAGLGVDEGLKRIYQYLHIFQLIATPIGEVIKNSDEWDAWIGGASP